MRLRTKIGFTVTALLAALAASIVLLLSPSINRLLDEEHRDGLLLLVEHVAEDLAGPVLRNDAQDIRRLITGYREKAKDIMYLYVLDAGGNVMAHTFKGDIPRRFLNVLDANRPGPDSDHVERAFEDEGKQVIDIGFRIPEGGGAEIHIGTADERHQLRVKEARLLVLAVGAFFIALGAALSFLLSYWITNSLVKVTAAMEAIGGGDLSHRVPVTSRDEIGTLAAAFNDMVARRAAAEDDVVRLGFELDERVQQRTAQLEAANKELEAFAYSVSHDLRAPLRSIDGFSKALLEDHQAQLDAEGKDFLRRVRKASQRMGQLIDDILSLSRVTRGDLFIEQVDLTALAREVAKVLQDAAEGRSVKVSIQEGITAPGDRKMLRVVLENLLGNAWKFTSKQAQGRITFGAVPSKDGTAFFVKDNGAGFDMAYSQKLFGAFQRLHSDAEFPGTGIGLATVRRIVHRHGGTVWAESEAGKGATFYFTLGRGAAA